MSGDDTNCSTQSIGEDADNYTIVQSPSNRRKRKRIIGEKVEKRIEVANRLQDSPDCIVASSESSANITSTKVDDPYSLENCIKMLQNLPSLVPQSPQFYLVTRVMVKPKYGETFISLKDDPNLQLGWLKTVKMEDMYRF